MLCSSWSIRHENGGDEDGFDDFGVEVNHHHHQLVELPQLLQEAHSLLVFFGEEANLQLLMGDGDIQEVEELDVVDWGVSQGGEGEWSWVFSLSPLSSPCSFKLWALKILVCTRAGKPPTWQARPHQRWVQWKLCYLQRGATQTGAAIAVQGMVHRRMQPWEDPVLVVQRSETGFPSLTQREAHSLTGRVGSNLGKEGLTKQELLRSSMATTGGSVHELSEYIRTGMSKSLGYCPGCSALRKVKK